MGWRLAAGRRHVGLGARAPEQRHIRIDGEGDRWADSYGLSEICAPVACCCIMQAAPGYRQTERDRIARPPCPNAGGGEVAGLWLAAAIRLRAHRQEGCSEQPVADKWLFEIHADNRAAYANAGAAPGVSHRGGGGFACCVAGNLSREADRRCQSGSQGDIAEQVIQPVARRATWMKPEVGS